MHVALLWLGHAWRRFSIIEDQARPRHQLSLDARSFEAHILLQRPTRWCQ
jgi:hypothetical protein